MSPRLSPVELQEARKHKQEEREEAQRRAAQEAAERAQREQEAAIEQERQAATRRQRDAAERQRYETLTTVAHSLYDELDKLTKKAPKELLSNLTLEQVNGLIGEVKEFLVSDPYLKGISTFEAAGDNPEYRDAVLIVGQLRAALQRFRAHKPFEWSPFR